MPNILTPTGLTAGGGGVLDGSLIAGKSYTNSNSSYASTVSTAPNASIVFVDCCFYGVNISGTAGNYFTFINCTFSKNGYHVGGCVTGTPSAVSFINCNFGNPYGAGTCGPVSLTESSVYISNSSLHIEHLPSSNPGVFIDSCNLSTEYHDTSMNITGKWMISNSSIKINSMSGAYSYILYFNGILSNSIITYDDNWSPSNIFNSGLITGCRFNGPKIGTYPVCTSGGAVIGCYDGNGKVINVFS